MLWLGVPVVDNHELTFNLIESLVKTVDDPSQLTVVVFDNNSDKPYGHHAVFNNKVVRYEKNIGYYRPINDLAKMATPADIVGLCHNDLIFYEKGWDRRLRDCFVKDGRLGMVGFCGSNEVDDRGGRGGGTMCNFRGEKGARTEDTGRRILDLQPALIFDSLFMALRVPVVECLGVDENFQLNHFGDRMWPLRAIEKGWRCGVLGIEIDHMSGQTLVGIARIEQDSRLWCLEHGIPVAEGAQAGTAVYLEAERRYLAEFRDQKHLIPAHMNGWEIKPLQY
jgi:hypothetical protein